MSDEYVVRRHVVSLACGQMLGPGETSDKVDPEDPGDSALIEEGLLVPRKKKPEVKISDAAKKKAAELGIDIDTVEGTGAGGSIKVEDVEAAKEKEEQNASGN